jgi:predicted nucleic-acid-binding Zn-ribbon protein
MKCPKKDCDGAMHRFRPKHLVIACHRADTGVLLELNERQWKQVGLMCGTCGYMEFYAEEPAEALQNPGGFFDSTEPEG